jgi:RHS repeat-associated protein
MIETRTQGNDDSPVRLIRYQFGNHLGSASIETDAAATVISYEEYHPFGTTSYQAVDRDIKAAAKRYRYTGMERDKESGLNYHSARYYVPWLGRWLSADPIRLEGGINLYAFVENNPIMSLDPTGTDGETCGVWDEEQAICYPQACPMESRVDNDLVPTPSAPPSVRVRRRPAPIPVPPLPAPPPPDETPAYNMFEEADEEEPLVEQYETYEETVTEYDTVTETVTENTGIRYAAAGAVAFMGGDVMIPEPTDLAPPKWLGYAIVGAGAALTLAHTSPRTTTRTREIPRTVTRTSRRPIPIVYVTYTKTNPVTAQVYAGRSRGYGTPQQIVAARDAAHHMTAFGFGPAALDRSTLGTLRLTSRWFDPAYQAIRGREQQLIDSYGGAVSGGGTSGNAIRGVARGNLLGRSYDFAASAAFGRLHSYTGN